MTQGRKCRTVLAIGCALRARLRRRRSLLAPALRGPWRRPTRSTTSRSRCGERHDQRRRASPRPPTATPTAAAAAPVVPRSASRRSPAGCAGGRRVAACATAIRSAARRSIRRGGPQVGRRATGAAGATARVTIGRMTSAGPSAGATVPLGRQLTQSGADRQLAIAGARRSRAARARLPRAPTRRRSSIRDRPPGRRPADAADLDMMPAGGIDCMRTMMPWGSVEQTPGQVRLVAVPTR